MNSAVFGAGKLGAPLIAVLASRGYRVTGIDTDREAVNHLNFGRAPITETGLAALIEDNKERINAVHVSECGVAIGRSEVVFVVVPTPSQEDGTFSCDYVEDVAMKIGSVCGAMTGYRLFVLVSTVMPGDTATKFLRMIERTSGKTCGKDFGVCYNPEFIAIGSVIRNMLHPDFVLIGESDKEAGDKLACVHNSICPDAPVRRMGLVSAEVTKLALNCYITTKISYANALSEICDKLPEADVHDVTDALGLDTRIGPKCLRAATAYGGPCFPRDNLAMIALAYGLGCVPSIPEATHAVNRRQTIRLITVIVEYLPRQNATIGILGTAYKVDTAITEESAGLAVIQGLQQQGRRVVTYDPQVSLGTDMPCAQKCVTGCDVIVIMLPYAEFVELDYTGKVVIDCWGILGEDR